MSLATLEESRLRRGKVPSSRSSLAAIVFLILSIGPASALSRQRVSITAQVTVDTGTPGCTVQLDADASVKSDAQGKTLFRDVDPTDHYIHVRCPGQKETGYLISPRVGDTLQLRAGPESTAASPAPASDPKEEPAEAKIMLRELVKQAVQLRAQARLEEAVKQLREAA